MSKLYVPRRGDPSDRSCWIVVVAETPQIKMHPMGGGFIYTSDPETFQQNYRPLTDEELAARPVLRRGLFDMDAFPDDCPGYAGYTSGQRWNGWAMPHFEKKVVDQMIADGNAANVEWDEGTYRITFSVEEDDDEVEVVEPEEVATVDGMKLLYGFGGSWCWIEREQ